MCATSYVRLADTPRLAVAGQHVIERFDGVTADSFHRLLHNRGNIEEADSTLQKCRDRHFIGGV